MKIVPNISSKSYTISAFLLGILLTDDLTPAEQNSLGNWFMLVGQTLCANSSQQQVLNNRNNISNSYNSHIINDNGLKKSADNIMSEINSMLKRQY